MGTETWTYASSNSITISGNYTATYTRGMKVKLVQGTSTKYFIIVKSAYGAPNTTLTFYGGSTYTVANAAITSHLTSSDFAPAGFPEIALCLFGHLTIYGSNAPSDGYWEVMDICWNTGTASGDTPGWVCTTSGTPGTWKAMANLA
jgi:hypothetical protein